MRIDVALVPAEAKRWGDSVSIVLDELRASSTIVTLLDRGAMAVVPAATLAEARRIARVLGSDTVLAGEHSIVRAPGFDFGNSPAEVARADLAGRTVVLSTRNGTAVLRSLPADGEILVGCLLNAAAVARAGYARARERGCNLGIVCAGRVGAFAIDDAIAAGAILERVIEAAGADGTHLRTVDAHANPRAGEDLDRRAGEDGGPRAGEDPDVGLGFTDAALAALQLWRSTPDLAAALRASWSGYLLAAHHLEEDIAASLPVDASAVVPVVVAGAPPRIVARPA